MKIKDIVRLVNTYLAGEQLTYDRMLPYLDETIDDINSQLGSTYPAFSSIRFDSSTAGTVSYGFIPDRYIRSVVAIGAAHKFFLVDEEGVDSAPDLGMKYRQGLFYMTRDFIEKVPEFFQDDTTGSVLIDEYALAYDQPLQWFKGIM